MASRTTTDPLEILLEMGVDLDNLSAEEDYLSALMEAVNTLTIKDPTDPRIAPLQLEVRNVRKKRFSEAKKTTIKPDAFFNREPEEIKDDVRSGAIDPKKLKFSSVSIAPKQKALPTNALVPNRFDEEEKDQKKTSQNDTKDTSLLANISKNVTDIADTLRQQYKQKQKASRSQRKNAEQANRKLKESKLEKSFNILGKTAEKMIKPVKSILDRIFDFIFKIFLARFLVKFLDWFGDPKNQEKVTSLIRFFTDHGPKILAAFLLFGTSIGRFLTGFAAKLVVGAAKLLIGVGKFAVTLAAKFPFLAPILAGAGLFALGAVIPKVAPDTVDAEEKKTKAAPGTKEEKLEKLKEQKENISFIDRLFGVDREIDEQIEFIETGKTKRYEGGGEVSGPSGTDKVPAMLTDGEFVMSKGAVQKFGVEQLEAMNASGGGTNRPKVVDNTLYASVGGYVGDKNKFGKKGTPERGYSSGSLMSDPLGAVDRILGKSTGIRLPSFSGSGQKKPHSHSQPKPQPKEPLVPPKPSKQETSADQTAMSIPEKMLKSPTFRDSGVLYLRSMLGGFGGKITEQDLSKASKDELNKAITRAKTRTAGELSTAERELAEAKSKGFNAQIIAERQSVVDRLKRGEVRVEYQDYYEGGKITPAAEDAKSILGKFWAATTDNGGYKVVNERYDFVDMKDPLAVLMGDSSGVSKNAKAGQPITLRQRLQAMHQLNPFARDMSVDMVLGQKETTERKMNNFMSKVGGVADFFTGNAFDFDRQGGSTLMNPSGQKLPTVAKPKGKPQPEPSKPKLTAAQIKNNQAYAASKGKYYSSTTGKTYENYAAALKDPAVAAGAKKMQQKNPSMMNMMMGGKDAYYSSTTDKYYKNYTEALKDPKVAAAAEVEKTKAKLSLATTPPKVTPPPPPSIEPKVTVIPAPADQSGDSVRTGNGSGSEVNARPTGNGNANKFKIFGITLPF